MNLSFINMKVYAYKILHNNKCAVKLKRNMIACSYINLKVGHREMVNSLVMLQIGQENVRVALVTYNATQVENFSLEAFSNKDNLLEALSKISYYTFYKTKIIV